MAGAKEIAAIALQALAARIDDDIGALSEMEAGGMSEAGDDLLRIPVEDDGDVQFEADRLSGGKDSVDLSSSAGNEGAGNEESAIGRICGKLSRVEEWTIQLTCPDRDEGRGGSVEKAAAERFGLKEARGEDFEVGGSGNVDHADGGMLELRKELYDSFGTSGADVGDRDRTDVILSDAACGFLLHPPAQVRRVVPEYRILGVRGAGDRDQAAVLGEIVYVVEGEAAAGTEEGDEKDAVGGLAEAGGEGVDFLGEVTAEGGIAAAHDGEVFAGGFGGDKEVAGDGEVEVVGLIGREAA